jgi:hypothetical protein
MPFISTYAMPPAVRTVLTSALLLAIAGCHRPIPTWRHLAAQSGCTPELLDRASEYDSTRVMTLVGAYRLVQVDTTPGWIELRNGAPAPEDALRLWAADSVNARWARNLITGARMRTNRPIVGAMAGHEDKGFTAENPQVAVESRALDYLVVRFTPHLTFDGPLWEFPIERIGSWGFGGNFVASSYVVPAGRDGEPLGQRAGFYCAFRQ